MIAYIHRKTGNRYLMLAHGVDCTNERAGSPVVIYCPDDNQHTIYVRSVDEFYEKFDMDVLKGDS